MVNRLQSIDIAKGITIFLMVIGHSSLPLWLSNWIWSFHMPFFFFVSGLLTSWNKRHGDFFKGKTKSLLVPFITYSIINLLIYPLYGSDDWGAFCIQILSHGWGGYALWFIPVLYFSLLLCRIIPHKNIYNAISILCFVTLGSLLSYFRVELPWTISTIPIACAYILIARLFAAQCHMLLELHNLKTYSLFIFAGCIICLLVSSNYRLDLACNNILPLIPLLISAIFGSIMILCISELVLLAPKIASIWSNIGSHTMEILAFSQCTIMIINRNVPMNFLLKYLILVIVLYVIVMLKRAVKQRNISIFG